MLISSNTMKAHAETDKSDMFAPFEETFVIIVWSINM